MKITIDYSQKSKLAIIKSNTAEVKATGFSIMAGNEEQVYFYLWGYYKPIITAFWHATEDPQFREFFHALKRRRQEITPQEALDMWKTAPCVLCGSLGSSCKCGGSIH